MVQLMAYNYYEFKIYELEGLEMMKRTESFDQEVELSLKLFVVLTRALQSIQEKTVADIKVYGLNKTEFGVLELLYHKEDQPIQKIGQQLLLASSSITYVVDKLEGKKLVERKACPKDRRVTYAGLTGEGIKLMDEIFPEHGKALHHILGGLDAAEKKEMIAQIKKLGLFAESV